jgi:cell shape-determining protein MreC
MIAAWTSDREKLLEENMHLELSLIEARQQSVLVKELFRQNTELKQILGRVEGREQIVAAVIARPPRLAYDTLIIDVGASDGIEEGSHVFVLGDIIIGEVSAVYPRTALVTLYSTAGRETDVLVGGVSAVAHGRGGGNYVIELPRDLQVATGTVVSLPGIDVSLFGVVENVVAHPADPVQELYFRNPYALSTLTFVTLDVGDALHAETEASAPSEIELP